MPGEQPRVQICDIGCCGTDLVWVDRMRCGMPRQWFKRCARAKIPAWYASTGRIAWDPEEPVDANALGRFFSQFGEMRVTDNSPGGMS